NQCEMTWAKFKQGGLLGCGGCYDAFESELTPLLRRAHEGATHHSGKVPARRSDGQVRKQRVSVSKLRRELQKAIDDEDYEAAARLRDEIKSAE
ncbi:MAG: UvrB/UvrC motif-containing protein, partial [Planctomycetota bacterium]